MAAIRAHTNVPTLVFGRNITLRNDTVIIRVFYAHVIFKFTPQFYAPNFTAHEIRSQTR